MSEEALGTDIDLSGVDTERQLLAVGLYKVQVKSIETSPNKTRTGDVLKITLALEQTGTSTKGQPINPGYPLFENISMVKTDKYDPRVRLAQFMEAVLGRKGSLAPLDQYLGKDLMVKVKIEGTPDSQYGEQNRVAMFVKKV